LCQSFIGLALLDKFLVVQPEQFHNGVGKFITKGVVKMDIPLSVVEAVKETKADLAEQPKTRKPYVKKLTKRILHAIGNGLRTSTSIANALGVDKAKIQSNLCHIKARGLVYSSKQEGKNEHKYHLTTDKPVLGTTDLTKKKARKPYAKRAVKVVKVEAQPMLGKYARELEVKVDHLTSKLNSLELTLVEKEKEVWTLECEVFDKKAVIKYLEEKLFQLGVRV
jgi:DNA-binding transcriptional regulator GbsR (MarR family)